MKYKKIVSKYLTSSINEVTVELIPENDHDNTILNKKYDTQMEGYFRYTFDALEITVINPPYYTFTANKKLIAA